MNMNVPMGIQNMKQPIFVKEMNEAGGREKSYVNINDIANINKVSDNYWEAQGINGRNPYGGRATYHFDDKSAMQIINYIA